MLVHEKDRKIFASRAQEALAGASGENFEVRLLRRDGAVVWVSLNWQPIHDEAGVCLGVRVSADDIQSRKEAEFKLLDTVTALRREQGLRDYYLTRSEEERSRLQALLDLIKLGVLFVDRDGRVQHANRMLKVIWGFPLDENLSGMRDSVADRPHRPRCARTRVAYRDRCSMCFHRASRPNLRTSRCTTGASSASIPRWCRGGSGTLPRTGLDLRGRDCGAPRGRGAGADGRARPLDQPLQPSSLPRRTRAHDCRRRSPENASRSAAVRPGRLQADQRQHGHQAGDEVLVRLAREVGAVVRRNEIFFRLGGDEFGVLAPDTDEPAITGLARRIGERVADMVFEFEGRRAGSP
jgi:PAS domain-containing protein